MPASRATKPDVVPGMGTEPRSPTDGMSAGACHVAARGCVGAARLSALKSGSVICSSSTMPKTDPRVGLRP